MLRGFFGNLIFAIIARMLCGNHLNSNDIKSKHIFINLTITFVNIKMFIFQPLLLKNKNIRDPHDCKALLVIALQLHYSNYKDNNDNNNNCSISLTNKLNSLSN